MKIGILIATKTMAEDYEFKPEKSENNTNSVLFVIVDAFEGIRINKLA